MKLETSRLILRDWNLEDVGDLVEGLNNKLSIKTARSEGIELVSVVDEGL